MRNMKKRLVSWMLVLVMLCGYLPQAVMAADGVTEPVQIIFDISKSSVIADVNGITGVTGTEVEPETSTTIGWADMPNYNIVVTGTADAVSGNHIEMTADCPENVSLTMRAVNVTANSSDKSYSAICNKAGGKNLTLNLEGENVLTTTDGSSRVLWTNNAEVRFVGQEGASLTVNHPVSTISTMYSQSKGTFVFENCAVTLDRALEDTNKVLSRETKILLRGSTVITDGTGKTFSRELIHGTPVELNISNGEIILPKVYPRYELVCGNGRIVYEDIENPQYIVTGNGTNRIIVQSPEIDLTLKDLTISSGGRSAVLVDYTDPADVGKILNVKISGEVNLTTGSASAFNTNNADAGSAVPENVKVTGVADDIDDRLIITRTDDVFASSNKAAVGVNLAAENLAVIINKNCNYDVTAGAGAKVTVGGYIGGKRTEIDDGSILGGLQYKFLADGRVFVPVADKNNGNIPTLLLPGSVESGNVILNVSSGWKINGNEPDAEGNVPLNFAEVENNTLVLNFEPSADLAAAGIEAQNITVRAMTGSDIPALYLSIGEDSENTMVDVDKDKAHDTKATGTATLLGAEGLENAVMEIKGRGNATWTYPKKGYQVKLDEKTSVLGMGKSKKWVLLANYADDSLLRNAIGFDLAEQLGLDFTSEWRYVDFYIDGVYYGQYIICEKVEAGANRIEVNLIDDILEDNLGKDVFLSEWEHIEYNSDYSKATVMNKDGKKVSIDLTGGYHMEFDNYADPLQFAAGNIYHVTVKEPECLGENPQSDESYTYIRNFMAAADAAILDTESDEFLKYIDMESFAQMWLLQEYTDGHDATDNMHIWKESDLTGDGRLHAGPAWDFDNSIVRDKAFADVVNNADDVRIDENNNNMPQSNASAADYNAYWIIRLMRHPEFKAEIVRQYNLHRNLFKCCEQCVCATATTVEEVLDHDSCETCYAHRFTAVQEDAIEQSRDMDTIRWSTKYTAERRVESAAAIRQFLCVRNTYLEKRINGWGIEMPYVTFKDGNTVVMTVMVGEEGLQTLPEVKNGCMALRWVYTNDAGETVEFTSATPVTENMTVTAEWSEPNLTLVQAKEATCIEDGCIAYYHCPECGKNFSDSAHTTEIVQDVVIPVDIDNHVNTERRDVKEPTETEPGYTGNLWCLDCGKQLDTGKEVIYCGTVFDVGLGSVIADANGITGVTGKESAPDTQTTILWRDVVVGGIQVVGTAAADSGYHIEMATDCPENVELLLSNVSITTTGGNNSISQYSAICNKTVDKSLTLNLEGENALTTNNWRLLWTEKGMIRFAGKGDGASLNLNMQDDGISMLKSSNGIFAFENCAVTMNRIVAADNKVASNGTTVRICKGTTITDAVSSVYNGDSVEIIHDIATENIIIRNEVYRKKYGQWTMEYPDVIPHHIVTGDSGDTTNRIEIQSPDVDVMLKNLTINAGDRSAVLLYYPNPADNEKQLTIKVSGSVNLNSDNGSTFNTSGSESGTAPKNVLVIGDLADEKDQLTINRTNDTESVSNHSAIGVNLTAKNLAVAVYKNCNHNVIADEGSAVYVDGYIKGEGTEVSSGRLFRGFKYDVTVDGRTYCPVLDKENGNQPTLLLPGGSGNAATLNGSSGWEVTCNEIKYDGSNVPLDFTGSADITLTAAPPTELTTLVEGVPTKEFTLHAMTSSDIPAVYMSVNEDSEYSMEDVNADPAHDTKAKGIVSILNDKSNGADLSAGKTAEIKGRGNATWNRAKKGYQIKLDEKANVLGMEESKKWVLLPSAADLSMMRSAIGFELAQKLGMEFAGNWNFVDFYVDGEYYGLYIICEKVEMGTNRIDITNLENAIEDAIGKDQILSEQTGITYSEDYRTATLADGSTIDLTGGYHLEFDNYDDPLQFATTPGAYKGIQRVTVKEPENLGMAPNTDECFKYIRDFMGRANDAVYGTDDAELQKYIDLESFAQMWLLKQYMDDYDAVANMHLWKESEIPDKGDGKIHAGLAWDFDNSMCRDTYDIAAAVNTAESHTRFAESGSAKWLCLLEKHPAFQEEVIRQYDAHKELFASCENCDPLTKLVDCDNCGTCYIHNFAAEQGKLIEKASAMDTVRWYGTKFSNMPVDTTNRATSLQVVEAFACARNKYLESRINAWYMAAKDDAVVIDFGLPVDISVLANDEKDVKERFREYQVFGVGQALTEEQLGGRACLHASEETALEGYGENVELSHGISKLLKGEDSQPTGQVRYTPADMNMNQTQKFSYAVKYKGANSGVDGYYYTNVKVIPAANIYYEDSCIEFKDAVGAVENSDGAWVQVGTAQDKTQAENRPGEVGLEELDQNHVYGYDPAYDACKTYSNGSAQKVTVNSETYTSHNNSWPTAQFTFTGTGFDVTSLVSNQTGTITVDVYQGTTVDADKRVGKQWIVDTYYGYNREQNGYLKNVWTYGEDGKWSVQSEIVDETGTDEKKPEQPNAGDTFTVYEPNYIWTVTNDVDNTLYQIPVITGRLEEYGTYTVVVTPRYGTRFDHTSGADGYDFYLDAVRVYNPAGVNGAVDADAKDAYVKDGEAWPEITEIRKILIDANSFNNNGGESVTGMVFVDGANNTNSLEEYLSYGPENEVYLAEYQAIAFKLKTKNPAKIASVQIGAKAPKGASNIKVNNSTGKEITTATEMYYKISEYVTWTEAADTDGYYYSEPVTVSNNGGNILSLTNIKITYKEDPAVNDTVQTVIDQATAEAAVTMMRSAYLGTIPVEEAKFKPETFNVSLKREKVKAGQQAGVRVETTGDVARVTIDGQELRRGKKDHRTGLYTWTFAKIMRDVGEKTFAVVAYDDKGTASQEIFVTVTVQKKKK